MKSTWICVAMLAVALLGYVVADTTFDWDGPQNTGTLTYTNLGLVNPAISGITGSADGAGVTRLIARASIGSDDWGVGTNGLGVTIPDNALVVGGYLDITTDILTATNDCTFGLELNGSADMFAQLLVTNATVAVGQLDLVPQQSAATSVKMTDDRELSIVVVNSPITAGVATVVVEYDVLAR